MFNAETLRQQIDAAIRLPSARFIITALIDGVEYDAGETVIGPRSNAADCSRMITDLASAALKRQAIVIEQGQRIELIIEDVPALY